VLVQLAQTGQTDGPLIQSGVTEIQKIIKNIMHRGQRSAASEYIKINLLPFNFVRHFVFDVYRFI